MSLKAWDGSSTSMATHSKRMTIFDVGSQRPCHWPVCGLAKIGWLFTGAAFDYSRATKWVWLQIALSTSFIIAQPSLSPSSHLPQGSAVMSKSPANRENSGFICVSVSVCVWIHTGVHLCRPGFRSSLSSVFRALLETLVVSEDTDWLNRGQRSR